MAKSKSAAPAKPKTSSKKVAPVSVAAAPAAKRPGRTPVKTARAVEFLQSKQAEGLTSRQVAERLGVSVGTVAKARQSLTA